MEAQNDNYGSPKEPARLLTKKQMAAELGICYRTIERWYNLGYVRRIRIGGRIFFSSAEIERIRDRHLYGQEESMNFQPLSAEEILGRHNNRISGR